MALPSINEQLGVIKFNTLLGGPVTVTNERKWQKFRNTYLKIEEKQLKMLQNTLVFPIIQLRTLCQISLECTGFWQDWYRPCCFHKIKWGKRSRSAANTANYYNDQTDVFLNQVVTCDETWLHIFEPESK